MKKIFALIALALAAVALVACGSSSDSSSTSATPGPAKGAGAAGSAAGGGGGSSVKLSADPSGQLKFDTSSLSAKAGNVTIAFDNPASIGHDVAVEDSSGKQLGVTDVITQSNADLKLNLKPGTYKFLCTVPGHAAAGMQGTLTVK